MAAPIETTVLQSSPPQTLTVTVTAASPAVGLSPKLVQKTLHD